MARFGMMITCNRPPEELVGSAQYIGGGVGEHGEGSGWAWGYACGVS
jgi:hypothetical protein